jgi:hypothetical protein
MTPNLPDLDAAVDVEIVRENVQAVQAIYFAYKMEELRLFQVVDRIVELYTQGQLPLGRGRAGELLYRYWRSSGERLTADERAGLYARALGVRGGSATAGQTNDEFLALWMRFMVAVSMFARQQSVDDLLRVTPPGTVSTATVRDAARALAANASQYGGGMVLHAARELSEQVRQMVDLLCAPELLQAFGARDMWQVVDQVNRNELGGARNVVRYRTQAAAGSRVLAWLAAHADQLSTSQHDFAVDAGLVDAVEQWLAVSGGADTTAEDTVEVTVEEAVEERVEEYGQPVESPAMKRPVIDMPAAVGARLDGDGQRT